MDFQNNIKNWVSLDNKIKNLQKETKQLREERGQLVNKILTYVETNNDKDVNYFKSVKCLNKNN